MTLFTLTVLFTFLFYQNSVVISDETPQHTDNLHSLYSVKNKTSPDVLESRFCEMQRFCRKPIDCAEILQMGYTKSDVYNIWPQNKIMNGRSISVFCDMRTDNGGWTVIQRRGDFLRPNDYFFKDWANYKIGFGDIERDFWLGNDNIFALTNQKLYSVRFDLTDVEGNHRYALYDIFFIEDENNKYKLTIQDYSGTANDSMTEFHNGKPFSTKDRDNDGYGSDCAGIYKGAWWYSRCHYSNLNGIYHKEKHDRYEDGVTWSKWKGNKESLYKTEIKIRPKDFRKTLI